MLFFLPKTLQDYQPIRLSGAIRHVGRWLTSGFGDLTYHCKSEVKVHTAEIKDSNSKSSLSKSSEEKTSDSHQNEIAIYCIHGTADRRNSFSHLAEILKDGLPKEITSIHLLSFPRRGRGESIEFFSKRLKDKIVLNKHQNVILIGHSRGCLIASYFAENLAAENGININAVINICGPFGGSKFALPPATWGSSSIKEMQINSEFLHDLSNQLKTTSNNYYYFSATNDKLVKPAQACIKEHKEFLTELDRHNHLSIMSSKRLAGHIHQRIHHLLATPKQERPTEIESKSMLLR